MSKKRCAIPPILAEALSCEGLHAEKLDFSQLLHVAVQKSDVKITCYQRDAMGFWAPNEDTGNIHGFVGIHGLSTVKREGDGCTPVGLYRLGFAFGNKPKADTLMPYRPVTVNSCWVDDPHSAHYNTWAEGGENGDWVSAEQLADYPEEYAFAVTIGYNMRRIPKCGSAIFMHCGHQPTAGCVAMPKNNLLAVLKWLDPGKMPSILIAKYPFIYCQARYSLL
ncbi:L,D-transpeptidase family protein [Oscillospiraceae bacterium WX1]